MKAIKRKRGQNTAEYLIMLSVLVVGSIGMISVLGTQIRSKFTQVSAALSGDDGKYKDARDKVDQGAKTTTEYNKKDMTIKGVDENELKSELK